MSAKVYVLNDRGEPQKTPGWFSWRHRTRDENDAARERYLSEHGRASRQSKAAERGRRNIVGDCPDCGLRHSVDRPCWQGES